MMSVTVWETMTVKEMVVHLFLEQSDATMLKAAIKVLAALRTKVAKIDDSLCYKTTKNLGKHGIQKRFC